MNDTKQPEALRLAECLDDGHCSLRNALHPAAAELRRLRAANVDCIAWYEAIKADYKALRSAVHKLHAAKGRYHTQISACDLYDLCDLRNERPTK